MSSASFLLPVFLKTKFLFFLN